MDTAQLWTAALGEIELSISRANFITWFKHTSLERITDGCALIRTPNGFAKEWIEKKCADTVTAALRKHNPRITSIRCIIGTPVPRDIDGVHKPQTPNTHRIGDILRTARKNKQPTPPTNLPHVAHHPTTHRPPQSATTFTSYLNARYTFDNFIVGAHNELAHAACRTVSASPGEVYNPLFIYGDVGLGKTHLLQSVGNAIIAASPDKRVLYTSSERFTSELIDAIHNNTISEFKRFYQTIDLLIIDDIQFLAGKEKTQDEFFHIFNYLYQQNKQIIISSDRPPHAIATLEARLRSRFEGGMIADISQPDFETRVAILQKKADEKDLVLPEDAAQYIAKHVAQNIRELEGALNKIAAICTFHNRIPSRAVVEEILGARVTQQTSPTADILSVVSDHFNITRDDLTSSSRKKTIAYPRQIAIFLMREDHNLSYPEIGARCGGRDHSTIMHSYRKIKKAITHDHAIRNDIDIIRQKLRNM